IICVSCFRLYICISINGRELIYATRINKKGINKVLALGNRGTYINALFLGVMTQSTN
ncbi:hypothetical protein Trydic_g18502, partial [Trypoxylus dichotomus]